MPPRDQAAWCSRAGRHCGAEHRRAFFNDPQQPRTKEFLQTYKSKGAYCNEEPDRDRPDPDRRAGLTACSSSAAAAAPESAAGSTAEAASGDLLSGSGQNFYHGFAMEGTWAPWISPMKRQPRRLRRRGRHRDREKLGVEPQFVEASGTACWPVWTRSRYDIMVNGVDHYPERAPKNTTSRRPAPSTAPPSSQGRRRQHQHAGGVPGKKTANTISSTYADLAGQYGATVTGVDDLNQTFGCCC